MLSNRPDAPGLARAKAMGLATAAVDHKIYAGREEFERSMQILLETYGVDFICLAGFMRLLTPWFIGDWQRQDAEHPPCPAAVLSRVAHP